MSAFEFGLDTFLPVTVDPDGHTIGGDQAIRNAVEEAVLAEAVGIDSFNIGEHYRTELMDSAGHVVLAAIAGRTERIRLGSAVTVLSTQDPVRLYTDFATLDAVSNGRAQLIVGRGSLTESFPLFGFDLADYEDVFEEKLDLLVRLIRDQPVTWSGRFRLCRAVEEGLGPGTGRLADRHDVHSRATREAHLAPKGTMTERGASTAPHLRCC